MLTALMNRPIKMERIQARGIMEKISMRRRISLFIDLTISRRIMMRNQKKERKIKKMIRKIRRTKRKKMSRNKKKKIMITIMIKMKKLSSNSRINYSLCSLF